MSRSSRILHTLSKKLPDDRPITALQIVESIERCPIGFYPIKKTYDQDQDADLWRDNSFLKRKSVRYLCLSKSEGLPDFVIQKIVVFGEKDLPPQGCSLLLKTVDSEQKAFRKKQLGYCLVRRSHTTTAITDIIVCNRLKKAPFGFQLAGDLNGLIVCYKMGNVQDTPANPDFTQNGRYGNVPPRPAPPVPSSVYPNLEDGDHDYEILSPGGSGPSRPAPRPPVQTQYSTHTLSQFNGLEGVPFIISPKFLNSTTANKLQIPAIKTRTMQQLLRDYNYDFSIERQT